MAWDLPPLNSELDAVNLVLRAKGLDQVTSIDLSDAEIATAVAWLDGADREVQSRGWYFNEDQSFQLAIAGDGTVPLPEGTLSVSAAYFYPQGYLYGERRGMLYNITNKTFQFLTPPIVDITVRLNYQDMPEVARKYVAIMAAHRAQGTDQSNGAVIQITNQMVTQALTPLEWAQDKAMPVNQVHDNLTVLGALSGFGGMPRQRIS